MGGIRALGEVQRDHETCEDQKWAQHREEMNAEVRSKNRFTDLLAEFRMAQRAGEGGTRIQGASESAQKTREP
jgi:hypothetical protein